LSVKIYNSSGSHLSSIQIADGKEGFVDWDASTLLAGIYYFSICSNDHALNTGKLVIVK